MTREPILLTFEIPRHTVLNSNQRLHYMTRARNVKIIREMARDVALASTPFVPDPPLAITATVQYARAGRHDAHNLQPTVKALIDGCVDGGLIVDDSDEYIDSVTFRALVGTGVKGHTTIHLKIEEVDHRAATAQRITFHDHEAPRCPGCGYVPSWTWPT